MLIMWNVCVEVRNILADNRAVCLIVHCQTALIEAQNGVRVAELIKEE